MNKSPEMGHMLSKFTTVEWLEFERRLTMLGNQIDAEVSWPDEQLRECGEFSVYRWFADVDPCARASSTSVRSLTLRSEPSK